MLQQRGNYLLPDWAHDPVQDLACKVGRNCFIWHKAFLFNKCYHSLFVFFCYWMQPIIFSKITTTVISCTSSFSISHQGFNTNVMTFRASWNEPEEICKTDMILYIKLFLIISLFIWSGTLCQSSLSKLEEMMLILSSFYLHKAFTDAHTSILFACAKTSEPLSPPRFHWTKSPPRL